MGNNTSSALMPCFNAVRYLRMAIASVLCQKKWGGVLLVADDWSTDGSWELLTEWSRVDDRVITERPFRERRGPQHLLNWLLTQATSSHVYRQDADDISLPNRFARLWELASDERDAVLIGSGGRNVTAEGIEFTYPWEDRHVNPVARGELEVLNEMRRHHCVLMPAALYKREAVLSSGGFDAAYTPVADWELCFRLGKEGSFRFVPEELYLRRIHSQQITRTMASRSAAIERVVHEYGLEGAFEYVSYRGGGFVPGHPEI